MKNSIITIAANSPIAQLITLGMNGEPDQAEANSLSFQHLFASLMENPNILGGSGIKNMELGSDYRDESIQTMAMMKNIPLIRLPIAMDSFVQTDGSLQEWASILKQIKTELFAIAPQLKNLLGNNLDIQLSGSGNIQNVTESNGSAKYNLDSKRIQLIGIPLSDEITEKTVQQLGQLEQKSSGNKTGADDLLSNNQPTVTGGKEKKESSISLLWCSPKLLNELLVDSPDRGKSSQKGTKEVEIVAEKQKEQSTHSIKKDNPILLVSADKNIDVSLLTNQHGRELILDKNGVQLVKSDSTAETNIAIQVIGGKINLSEAAEEYLQIEAGNHHNLNRTKETKSDIEKRMEEKNQMVGSKKQSVHNSKIDFNRTVVVQAEGKNSKEPVDLTSGKIHQNKNGKKVKTSFYQPVNSEQIKHDAQKKAQLAGKKGEITTTKRNNNIDLVDKKSVNTNQNKNENLNRIYLTKENKTSSQLNRTTVDDKQKIRSAKGEKETTKQNPVFHKVVIEKNFNTGLKINKKNELLHEKSQTIQPQEIKSNEQLHKINIDVVPTNTKQKIHPIKSDEISVRILDTRKLTANERPASHSKYVPKLDNETLQTGSKILQQKDSEVILLSKELLQKTTVAIDSEPKKVVQKNAVNKDSEGVKQILDTAKQPQLRHTGKNKGNTKIISGETQAKNVTPAANTIQKTDHLKHGNVNVISVPNKASHFSVDAGNTNNKQKAVANSRVIKTESTSQQSNLLKNTGSESSSFKNQMSGHNEFSDFSFENPFQKTGQNGQFQTTVREAGQPFHDLMSKTETVKQVIDQVVQSSRLHISNGKMEIRVQLKPEHLGYVQIVVQQNKKETKGILYVERPEVKKALEMHLPVIQKTFQEQNIRMDRLEVQNFSNQLSQHNLNQQSGQNSNSPAANTNNNVHFNNQAGEPVLTDEKNVRKNERNFGYNTMELTA